MDPPVLVAKSAAVKIREVRAISRKDRGGRTAPESSETIRQTRGESRGMIWSDLHGDMQSATEMSAPPQKHVGSNSMNGPKVRNREPTLPVMAGVASGYMLGHLGNPSVLGS